LLYSSGRNDLSNYKTFNVSASYDGSLVINVMNHTIWCKAIHALLPNGSTIYIDLNFLNKNISRLFPLNMRYYLLLYNNDKNYSTGIVLDWNKQVIK
ncbi:2603_t:CDS:1, partial [Gigaspora margarita]